MNFGNLKSRITSCRRYVYAVRPVMFQQRFSSDVEIFPSIQPVRKTVPKLNARVGRSLKQPLLH